MDEDNRQDASWGSRSLKETDVIKRPEPEPTVSMDEDADPFDDPPTYETKTYDMGDCLDVLDRVLAEVERYEKDNYESPDAVIVGVQTAEYIYALTQSPETAPVASTSDGLFIENSPDSIRIYAVDKPMIEAVGDTLRRVLYQT